MSSHSARSREMVAGISDKGRPPCCRVSEKKIQLVRVEGADRPLFLFVLQTCTTDAPSDVVQARRRPPPKPSATTFPQSPSLYTDTAPLVARRSSSNGHGRVGPGAAPDSRRAGARCRSAQASRSRLVSPTTLLVPLPPSQPAPPRRESESRASKILRTHQHKRSSGSARRTGWTTTPRARAESHAQRCVPAPEHRRRRRGARESVGGAERYPEALAYARSGSRRATNHQGNGIN